MWHKLRFYFHAQDFLNLLTVSPHFLWEFDPTAPCEKQKIYE